ncbi:MAG: hypothetical protein ACK57J_01690, partial [Rubrivivax sp.]
RFHTRCAMAQPECSQRVPVLKTVAGSASSPQTAREARQPSDAVACLMYEADSGHSAAPGLREAA